MKWFLSSSSDKGNQRNKPEPTVDDAKRNYGGFQTPYGCLMIFDGMVAYESKHRQKIAHREIYTAEPAMPSFLRWSESTITFDRSDHPDSIS